ncbi:MAG: glycoside hydrolase family 9 protein [Spirochaetes bacterium]|nr:glycoside hydrolase family 9 protein [Spirochaetota bacterium]
MSTLKKCMFYLLLLPILFFSACDDDSGSGNGNPGTNAEGQLFGETQFTERVYPWILMRDKGAEATLEELSDGSVKINVTRDTKSGFEYGLQFVHPNLEIQNGKTYTLRFEVRADKNISVGTALARPCPDYKCMWNDWGDTFTVSANQWVEKEVVFTMQKDTEKAAECYIRFGGNGANYNVWIRNVSLTSDDHVFSDMSVPSSIIRVNQLGYLPKAVKRTSIVLGDEEPVAGDEVPVVVVEEVNGSWRSTDVALVRHAFDQDAGEYVAVVDFTSIEREGVYKIRASYDGETVYSHKFIIGSDIYAGLKKHAVDYFYYNRIGEVEARYAARPDLAREKGNNHTGTFASLSESDLYSNDFGDAAADYQNLIGPAFTANIQSGWYDAGDYGLYVVNGGIAAWTLLNLYERMPDAFGDGSLPYRTSANQTPDIIEVVDDELRFMLAMQRSDGMVHHKIHKLAWSEFPNTPAEDAGERKIFPVSTAATLNFGAVAAQASRIYMKLSKEATGTAASDLIEKAEQYLTAAEKAWSAARANPAIYAPSPRWQPGGGPYDDTHVADEFYWAAAELFVTTGKQVYLDYLQSSDYYLQMESRLSAGEDDGYYGSFTWGNTAGMGTVSLSLAAPGYDAGNSNESIVFVTESMKTTARNNIISAADVWIQNINTQGYSTPIKAVDGSYPWGSNSFVLNISIALAYAFDYSADIKYINGIAESMDYVLGRNAMDTSYITGYGERTVKNPHHRVWANQLGDQFPEPAPGAISGGPNNGGHCPYGYSYLRYDEIAPQKSYIDSIQAWSTNEVTVNWNAPLTWVTAYLDENKDAFAVQNQTLSISLTEGWNLISINVVPEDASIAALFAGNIDKIVEIKDNDGFYNTSQPAYLQSLTSLTPAQGYLINVTEPFVFTVEGAPVEAGSLNLRSGWNMVGCPWSESIDISTFIGSFSISSSLITTIKNFDGFYEYGNSLNSLDQIEPGKGYQVYVERDCVISW